MTFLEFLEGEPISAVRCPLADTIPLLLFQEWRGQRVVIPWEVLQKVNCDWQAHGPVQHQAGLRRLVTMSFERFSSNWIVWFASYVPTNIVMCCNKINILLLWFKDL